MSQLEQVLRHLMNGHTLTRLEAVHLYGTWSLPHHVYELRKRGFKIKSRIKENFLGQRYAEYYMPSAQQARK